MEAGTALTLVILVVWQQVMCSVESIITELLYVGARGI